MTPLAFAAKWNGRYLQSGGGLGGECVDVANEWIAECCKLQHVFRNAIDWAGPGLPGMKWTANAPKNAPQPGALVVWAEGLALGTGPNGHIALVLAADRLHLCTFDQNWPVGHDCALVLHSYAGVLGWQTPAP